ncbi:hypothetical protein AAGG74_15380 [Bacillus mexicanus]|uniref:hypothetical protein n=1 Tax=Bacillus mexicanus TaxID=2834415 RepID=UPI003D253D47
MNRIEKEKFICKAWTHFKTDSDNIETPNLTKMNDNQIDAMFYYFKFCYQEEKSDL